MLPLHGRLAAPGCGCVPEPSPHRSDCRTNPCVTRAPGGITYDRGALEDWIKRVGTDPATGHPLSRAQLYANLCVRDMICDYFIVRECLPDASAGGRSLKASSRGSGSVAAAAAASVSASGGGDSASSAPLPRPAALQVK